MRSFQSIVAAALLTPLLGIAAPVTYDFTVTATSGSLTGQSSSGYFTYDDSIAPAGGGAVLGALLTDLSFVWNGIAYDETTANTAGFIFDASGVFTTALFGTQCSPGICGVSSSTEGWYVRNNGLQFAYSTGDGTMGAGTSQFAQRVSEVPEPATLGLTGLALAALLAMRSRRRPA